MPARGGATALVAMSLAMITGCRNPATFPAAPAPTALATAQRSVEPSGQDGRPVRTFTIAFATFIPADYLLGLAIHPQSYASLFPLSAWYSPATAVGLTLTRKSFRARQAVTVVPDEADDPDGLVEGSKQNLGGITEAFDARLALTDGRIDACRPDTNQ